MQNNYNLYEDIFKDERIEFIEQKITGNNAYIFLKLHPKNEYTCQCCGSNEIIKNGVKSRIIKYPLLNGYKTTCLVSIHRMQCKKCGKMFNDECPAAPKGQNIPLKTKILIMEKLKDLVTFEHVASECNVSKETVLDIFDSLYDIPKYSLSETLCFDEIKNIDNAEGNYAFVLLDPINERLIDVLEDRRTDKLETYFYGFEPIMRQKVKYIVTDMYEPYRQIIKRCFNNATHVVDEFHYTRYVTDALTSIRIKTMKNYDENSPQYRILKRYWKLINIRKDKIKINHSSYNPIRKKITTLLIILDDMLNLNNELSEAYKLTQSFYKGMDTVQYQNAREWLDNFIIEMINSKMNEFVSVAHTFINWETEIINSFIRFGDKRLNNGPIEGMNSYLKRILKIANGFKVFSIFRKRLVFTMNKDYKFKNTSKKAKA